MPERITKATPENEIAGHIFRYRMASGFLDPGDTVLDAACGVGYGSKFLTNKENITYYGVDKSLDHIQYEESDSVKFIKTDLTNPKWLKELEFDVFVGFETIEHLEDYNAYIHLAKRAKKWVCLSAPVVPTVHLNPYHLHDFEPGQLSNMFPDSEWESYEALAQPRELSEIYIFKRKTLKDNIQ